MCRRGIGAEPTILSRLARQGDLDAALFCAPVTAQGVGLLPSRKRRNASARMEFAAPRAGHRRVATATARIAGAAGPAVGRASERLPRASAEADRMGVKRGRAKLPGSLGWSTRCANAGVRKLSWRSNRNPEVEKDSRSSKIPPLHSPRRILELKRGNRKPPRISKGLGEWRVKRVAYAIVVDCASLGSRGLGPIP